MWTSAHALRFLVVVVVVGGVARTLCSRGKGRSRPRQPRLQVGFPGTRVAYVRRDVTACARAPAREQTLGLLSEPEEAQASGLSPLVGALSRGSPLKKTLQVELALAVGNTCFQFSP